MSGGLNMEGSWYEMKVIVFVENLWVYFYWEDI